jgi:hypothetical protein
MRNYIRCYICNSIHKPTYKDLLTDAYLCAKCIKAGKEAWAVDQSSQIDALIRELEERIPDLFDDTQLACPGNCFCSCTFTDGCILLKKRLDKSSKL